MNSTINIVDDSGVAVICSKKENSNVLHWYADLFGDRNIHFIKAPAHRSSITVPGFVTDRNVLNCEFFSKELTGLIRKEPLQMVLADWSEGTQELSALLGCVGSYHIPSLIIHQKSLDDIKRVIVASAGGPHTLQQMWVASEIAAKLCVPLQVVRLRRTDNSHNNSNDKVMIEGWTSRMLGTKSEPIETDDLVNEFTDIVQVGDLLIMGAPGPFHQQDCIDQSLPVRMAAKLNTPLLIMLSGKPRDTSLGSLLWGDLIQMNLCATDKQDVIRELVDTLVRHYQAPDSKRNLMIELAMRREKAMSTAIDCQTAFPHVKLPGFRGLACCLGIYPDGVAFDSSSEQLTHFVFLMVTNDGYCDEYLALLAKLAKMMVRDDIRKALLESSTPEQVLALLEPQQNAINNPAPLLSNSFAMNH